LKFSPANKGKTAKKRGFSGPVGPADPEGRKRKKPVEGFLFKKKKNECENHLIRGGKGGIVKPVGSKKGKNFHVRKVRLMERGGRKKKTTRGPD